MKKEPWNSSSEKAKSLTIDDFGLPADVLKMAKMPRTANSRAEAVKILKQIAGDGNLTSKSGLVASLSGKSIDKIVSERTLHRSFETAAHWLAAANLDKLFSNAIEPWKFELNPKKDNINLKDRLYLFAPMEYKDLILPVKITLKKFKQEGLNNRIYSIETVNVDLRAKK